MRAVLASFSLMERLDWLKWVRAQTKETGVYLMKDSDGIILYVGKAKNLRNRLVSYFQPEVHELPRVGLMRTRVCSIETIVTETESEALLLEATLIKRHRPRFNIRLKDDKSYPHLKLSLREATPRLLVTRRVVQDGSRYFGPFPSGFAAKACERLLIEHFKLRDCSDNTFRHRSRPCILYQMDRCSAPCVGLIEVEPYRALIDTVAEVLEGGPALHSLLAQLRERMQLASEKEDFELAAYLRDQTQHLALVTEKQAVIEAGVLADKDCLGILLQKERVHVCVLRIRGGKLVATTHYKLENVCEDERLTSILEASLTALYVQTKETKPREVLVEKVPPEMDWLERNLGFCLREPEGLVEHQLMKLAMKNAEGALKQHQETFQHSFLALESIQELLHLKKLPRRLECFDISHFQGSDTVASRVVFIDGRPEKQLYRRYLIRSVDQPDDFASMYEVLERRFKGDPDLPDLLVVDGGRGQLSQAVRVLENLGVSQVPVVGLAKARTESAFQSREVVRSKERLFLPHRMNPVALAEGSEAFKLLTHLRDEAHRFALAYHQHRRRVRHSGLE